MKARELFKILKEKNIFGDYILAKRKSPYREFDYPGIEGLINLSLHWSDTPQGYQFWYNVYRGKI